MMPINKLIKKRRSIVAFDTRPVEEQKLMQLFEAARWAASSFNEQPWRFIYAHKGSEGYTKLFSALLEGNKKWAGNAPVLILTLTKATFSANEKPNRHAQHDLGLAVGNLSLQATELGLYLHQMAGFDPALAVELLQVPKGYEPLAVIALGYPQNEDKIEKALKERQNRPRKRRPLEEFIHKNNWQDRDDET